MDLTSATVVVVVAVALPVVVALPVACLGSSPDCAGRCFFLTDFALTRVKPLSAGDAGVLVDGAYMKGVLGVVVDMTADDGGCVRVKGEVSADRE